MSQYPKTNTSYVHLGFHFWVIEKNTLASFTWMWPGSAWKTSQRNAGGESRRCKCRDTEGQEERGILRRGSSSLLRLWGLCGTIFLVFQEGDRNLNFCVKSPNPPLKVFLFFFFKSVWAKLDFLRVKTLQGHPFSSFQLREGHSQSQHGTIPRMGNPSINTKHTRRIPLGRSEEVWRRKIVGRRRGLFG